MFSGSRGKPYTAVTVHVERLTSPEYEENDWSGIVDLIEVIRIQDTGPTEAARALRKKLKYGNTHRQLRALTILDGLIQNAGPHFQRTFADEMLLERLRILPNDDITDQEVRNKCNMLYRQWAAAYKDTPGLKGVASLYKQLPKRARAKPTANQSRVLRENEAEAERENPFATEEDLQPQRVRSNSTASSLQSPPPAASSSSSRNRAQSTSNPGGANASHTSSSFWGGSSSKKKGKPKPFSLEREKPQILSSIAQSSIASTNLLNALKFVNRETTPVSEDRDVMRAFDECKRLRRQILRYIQLVESDQWIGSLLSANDELVKALMAWEIMDKSIEDDSDSDDGLNGTSVDADVVQPPPRKSSRAPMEDQFRGMSITPSARSPASPAPRASEPRPPAKPPRPPAAAPPVPKAPPPVRQVIKDDDDDDPFGDENAI